MDAVTVNGEHSNLPFLGPVFVAAESASPLVDYFFDAYYTIWSSAYKPPYPFNLLPGSASEAIRGHFGNDLDRLQMQRRYCPRDNKSLLKTLWPTHKYIAVYPERKNFLQDRHASRTCARLANLEAPRIAVLRLAEVAMSNFCDLFGFYGRPHFLVLDLRSTVDGSALLVEVIDSSSRNTEPKHGSRCGTVVGVSSVRAGLTAAARMMASGWAEFTMAAMRETTAKDGVFWGFEYAHGDPPPLGARRGLRAAGTNEDDQVIDPNLLERSDLW